MVGKSYLTSSFIFSGEIKDEINSPLGDEGWLWGRRVSGAGGGGGGGQPVIYTGAVRKMSS